MAKRKASDRHQSDSSDDDVIEIPASKFHKTSENSLRTSKPAEKNSFRSSQGYPTPVTPQSSYTQHSEQERDGWLRSTQELENDMRQEIDLTQDDDESAYENLRLYGILNTKIVGCRFYDGRATVGEYVVVRREPSNPYDSNAIRIDNVMHNQIGHIGRHMAAKLAPFLDSGSLKVEGTLTGLKGDFDCPIALKLFGTSGPGVDALKQKMQQAKLPVSELIQMEKEKARREKEMEKQKKAREKAAAALRKGGAAVYDPEGPNKYSNLNTPTGAGDGSADNLQNIFSDTAVYNPREIQSAVNKFGMGEDVLQNMEKAQQPEALFTTLLPYQLQGLKWMLDHESPKLPTRDSGEMVQMWKESNGRYTNMATSFCVNKAPELASGGILADDMGLGKTIQVISLIMADSKQNRSPTLIIAPLTVMSNWANQAKQHVKKKFAPRTLIYHGQENRGLTPEQFKEYDIVITTYQTMTIELFPFGKDKPGQLPAKKGLFSIEWRRIVLDEGHQIRNPKAKMSRAACALMAQSRWLLSGTPIVNSLKDLYSHVKFLRLSGGLNEFEIFNGTLIRPIKSGNPDARNLLQVLMATLCLRRTKDMKFVDLKLPDITYHKFNVKFLPHEQERYDAFKAEAKGLVEEAKAKKGDNTMTNLLEVLLRLRQTCNHWKMCGEDRVKRLLSLMEGNTLVDIMDPKKRRTLQDLLQLKMDNQEECPICMETMNEPRITVCAHAFCQDCIERVITTQHKCPMCRADLADTSKLVEPAADMGEGEDGLDTEDIDPETSSSKIEALIKILKASATDAKSSKSKSKSKGENNIKEESALSPNGKTVIFSQWTTFLTLLEPHLHAASIPFVRLDGKTPPQARDAALETFASDPDVPVLLASLGVCSVGLNLVAANNVILADSWWAPSIEDQAVDRVHRLGQTRACRVVRLVVEGTVEDEVLEIQERKRKVVAAAFGDGAGKAKSRGGRSEGTLDDIARMLR